MASSNAPGSRLASGQSSGPPDPRPRVARSLAFYTIYCGPDVGNGSVVPPRPTSKYDCYFISNNESVLLNAKNKGFSTIQTDQKIHGDARLDSMEGRYYKINLEKIDALQHYDYTCYHDTKRIIDVAVVEDWVRASLGTGEVIATRRHPCLINVFEDFTIGMVQDRYRQDCVAYATLLNKYCHTPGLRTSRDYIESCIMVRKNCPEAANINKEWFQLTQEQPGTITHDQLLLAIVFHRHRAKFGLLGANVVHHL